MFVDGILEEFTVWLPDFNMARDAVTSRCTTMKKNHRGLGSAATGSACDTMSRDDELAAPRWGRESVEELKEPDAIGEGLKHFKCKML